MHALQVFLDKSLSGKVPSETSGHCRSGQQLIVSVGYMGPSVRYLCSGEMLSALIGQKLASPHFVLLLN